MSNGTERERARAAALLALTLTACGHCASSSSTTKSTVFRNAVIQAPTPLEAQAAAEHPGKAVCADGLLPPACIQRRREVQWVHPDFQSSQAFCRNLMLSSQSAYKKFGRWGLPLSIIGLSGTAAGTTWAAIDGDNQNRGGAIGLAVGSAMITAAGAFLIKRAISSAEASGEAGVALSPNIDDQKRWDACLAVRAKWIGANANALLVAEQTKEESKAAVETTESKAVEEPAAFKTWFQAACGKPTSVKVEGAKFTRCYKCSAAPLPANAADAKAVNEAAGRYGGIAAFQSLDLCVTSST